MQEIKRFQVRGVPDEVVRVQFGSRIVDYWIPKGGTDRLLIAHDGQNVFDGKTSTHRGQTWKMAQSAIHVSQELRIDPPAIIAVWHSRTRENPWGRAQDLVPQQFLTRDVYIDPRWRVADPSFVVKSDEYFDQVFNTIVPAIFPNSTPEKTAVIGSSMGGLATLYAAITHPEKFSTALALSPHWVISDENFVRSFIQEIPLSMNIWLSIGTKGLDAEYLQFHELAKTLLIERGMQSRFSKRIF